jgi:hypothetical protein
MIRLALFLVLLASPTVSAQYVVINGAHRTPNVPQGCCGYCVLETAARHHGHHSLAGTVAARTALPWGPTRQDPVCGPVRSHPCHSWQKDLVTVLSKHKIPHDSRPHGSYDRTILAEGVAGKRPVLFSTKGRHRCEAGHWWLMLGDAGSHYRVWDPNRAAQNSHMPKDFFEKHWQGDSLALRNKR